MADTENNEEPKDITFNIKSSSDQKHMVTVSESLTVLDLKTKLATNEYADIPADRQRLIYSGRVMKDADTLATYKIKDGNTVHMVKGAASNQQRNQANNQSSSSSVPPNAGVPQNLAAGTGNDPLAGLTGARYAGFAQMPGADTFGADGGMGAPRGPEDLLQMLDNPMMQQQMNEAMNNPHVIRMLENNPMFRDNPMMRQMFSDPEVRRTMMDPNFIRASIRMQRAMGRDPMAMGGANAMPAPGATNTTPGQTDAAAGVAAGTTDSQAQGGETGAAGSQSQQPNPFAMFGQPGMGGAANPFGALFGGMNPPNPSNTTTSNTTESQPQGQQQPGQQPPNPFAMFGTPAGGDGQQTDPFAHLAQQMAQNPEMMRQAMAAMGGGGSMGGMGGMGGQGAGGFNPFAAPGGTGMGAPQQPADTRPPEEQYADQLRQLNDMGFFDFNQNVRALRMAGGRVEGAIEMLLGGSV